MAKALERRDFLKGSACMAAGIAAAGALSGAASTAKADEPAASEGTYADTIAWDGEYDVVVLGFGGSGANAAYAAAKEGASVLAVDIAEKGEEGGNFRLAGQGFLQFDDYDSAYAFTKAEFGGYDVDEDTLVAWCNGVTQTIDILVEMGADRSLVTNSATFGYGPEYDQFPGVEGRNEYNLHAAVRDAFLWQFIRNCCVEESDKIDLWLNSPAKHLIQAEDTKTILGAEIEHNGELVKIRAKNGVVLCTGGFENNPDMWQQYLGIRGGMSMSNPRNNGDGLIMAQEVGAGMCHMWAYDGTSCPFGSGVPYSDEPYIVTTTCFKNDVMKNGSIMAVSNGGTRFMNETVDGKHGKFAWGGGFYNVRWPEHAYVIWDDAKHQEILESGYLDDWLDQIISADSWEDLAAAADIEAEPLQETVAEFNDFIDMGKDYLTDRDIETMSKFGEAPYYALEIVPGFHATRGGPRKNADMQILDPDGNPIPHFFGAGELGSFFTHLRSGGGGLTECIIFGQIAGRSAAAPKDDLPPYDGVMVPSNLIYTLGSSPSDLPEEELDETVADNEYIGTSEKGMGGRVALKVTIDDGTITAIDVIDQSETDTIGVPAFEPLIEEALAAQSSDIEAVSGATVTSNAFMEALADAMAQAGL